MVLRKSVRERRRYIMFSVHGDFGEPFERVLMDKLRQLLGLLNMPRVKIVSRAGNVFVARCDRQRFADVRAALALMYSDAYRIKLLGSSGTLKALRSNRKLFIQNSV